MATLRRAAPTGTVLGSDMMCPNGPPIIAPFAMIHCCVGEEVEGSRGFSTSVFPLRNRSRSLEGSVEFERRCDHVSGSCWSDEMRSYDDHEFRFAGEEFRTAKERPKNRDRTQPWKLLDIPLSNILKEARQCKALAVAKFDGRFRPAHGQTRYRDAARGNGNRGVDIATSGSSLRLIRPLDRTVGAKFSLHQIFYRRP